MGSKRSREALEDPVAEQDVGTADKRTRTEDRFHANGSSSGAAVGPSTSAGVQQKHAPQPDHAETAAAEPAGSSGADAVAYNAAAIANTDTGADSGSDDEPVLPAQGRRGGVKKGSECPYLDTVSRKNLDFDFEKCCSVSLSPVNVYACLVCGKYFQGRGPKTHAYTHALEVGHQMFMKLEDGKVYCLPDGYEVQERSLDDIRYVLNPTFTAQEVDRLDTDITWRRTLDGSEYMPGLVGLNDMRANDYANVIIQMLARCVPLRNYFLVPANYASSRSELVQRFGELMRKIWNPRNYKGQVSPHEFMQTVMAASGKRFTIEKQSDPVEFFAWLLNTLHLGLTNNKRKKSSIITRCFQGELQITTEAGTGKAVDSEGRPLAEPLVERVPFLVLGMDLPPAPLYKDALERNIIPQVPIFEILQKYDGQKVHDDIKLGRRHYLFTRLPRFLAMHMKRFTKNNFYIEKNPTIVNFPVKNLLLKDVVPVPTGKEGKPLPSKYNLLANVVHDGKAGEGSYRVHIHRKVEDKWYEVQDLRVTDILPQMVALSESYMQIYELQQ